MHDMVHVDTFIISLAIVFAKNWVVRNCKSQTYLLQAILHVVAYLYYNFQVVEEKELAIAQMENKKLLEQEAAEKTAEKLAEKEPELSTSPRKDNWQSIFEIPEIASISQKMFRDQLNRSAQANV